MVSIGETNEETIKKLHKKYQENVAEMVYAFDAMAKRKVPEALRLVYLAYPFRGELTLGKEELLKAMDELANIILSYKWLRQLAVERGAAGDTIQGIDKE